MCSVTIRHGDGHWGVIILSPRMVNTNKETEGGSLSLRQLHPVSGAHWVARVTSVSHYPFPLSKRECMKANYVGGRGNGNCVICKLDAHEKWIVMNRLISTLWNDGWWLAEIEDNSKSNSNLLLPFRRENVVFRSNSRKSSHSFHRRNKEANIEGMNN